jgi:hypothetical protein
MTFPGSAGRCGPPLQAGCFVSRLSASKDSAQITLRHPAFRTVAVAPSSTVPRGVQQFWPGPVPHFKATPRRSRSSGGSTSANIGTKSEQSASREQHG